MKRIKNIKEMFDYLDTINDKYDAEYDSCKVESHELYDTYVKFLMKILEFDEVPKRVVDIGSNLNQYAYIFENVGIDYIGIDCYNKGGKWKPYESDHVKFILGRYEDMVDEFKDDVIISQLCVGYQVDINCVRAKHLIVNHLDEDKHDFIAKLVW